ncbi:hypothetical protein [Virgisporangium aurantiacum]|uniref:hypothetical protein n=1 Tax=Virgisporangium aurantiacum TaxID=175570 RepID=UPI00194F7957|nr:hypothetical protein [Virgisporangium aurantiacum]
MAGAVGLVVAVLAAGRLLTMPEPAAPPPPPTAETAVTDLWPSASIVRSPGRLGDGRAYTPLFHLDPATSVGTALTGDGAHLRLIVRSGSAEREVLRRPAGDNPQFNGFATAGDDLVFMVSSNSDAAAATSVLYRASWRAGGASVLTADTGAVIFFNSQYDVVIIEGRVHWAAAGEGTQSTEVRSVPLGGGRVAVQSVDGAYALSAWPWLTSAGGSQGGSVELRNLVTGERRTVSGAANELVNCGPVWCRVMILGAAGQPARTDVMRPDGSDRKRMAAGTISSAVLDVALIDRFEVLAQTTSSGTGTLKLMLFDVSTGRSAVLATAVATVQARGSTVWWSTGSDEAVEWFALDLGKLT